ncbi:MAG: SDR family NAD(P)-dependent oxidoreductase [Sporichthyaceae bacterium]
MIEPAGPRVAVVTGGGSGIGAATALRLLAEGWQVVIGDLNADALAATAAAARTAGTGDRLHLAVCDVTSEADIEALVGAAIATFGALDAMVNNAGVPGAFGAITEIEAADWDYTFAVLVRGVFLGTKHAGRAFAAAGAGGAIVNVASVAALSGGVGPQAYSAAKAAVISLTQTTAVELAAQRIRVNAVAPGPVLTPILGGGPERMATTAEVLTGTQPWPDAGRPTDIAAGIAFLLSPDAGFITGQTLVIDGGQSAGGPREAMRRLADPVAAGIVGVSRGSTGQDGTMRKVR